MANGGALAPLVLPPIRTRSSFLLHHRRSRNSTGSASAASESDADALARGLSPPVRILTDPGARIALESSQRRLRAIHSMSLHELARARTPGDAAERFLHVPAWTAPVPRRARSLEGAGMGIRGCDEQDGMAEAGGFEALAARPYADVLIVGGGINGLATFRDLAMQGVDVALVERSRLRQRRIGRVVAHDPRRHPLSRERRVPPRPRGGHRAQRAAADRAALRAAAADDDPDLLDLLGGAQRAAAVPASRRRQAHRARCRAHQDRPRHLRLVLARRRPGAAPRVPRPPAVARSSCRS